MPDLKIFAEELQNLESEAIVAPEYTNPYLIDRVFNTYNRGGLLKISDIDYGKFELDELRILADYYYRVCAVSDKLRGFNGLLCEMTPEGSASRFFC